MSEENKATARRFYDAWNDHDPDALADVLASDYVSHTSLPGVSNDAAGMKQWVAATIAAFPDIAFTVEDQVAEGDRVATRWSARGTHENTFMGIPGTGKKVTVTGINITRHKDGKSVEGWGEWDKLGMMQQLGAIPDMA